MKKMPPERLAVPMMRTMSAQAQGNDFETLRL